jgi:hypothetical protein
MARRFSVESLSRLTSRIDVPGARLCTMTCLVTKITSGTERVSNRSAMGRNSSMFAASIVKSSSGRMAEKITSRMASMSTTSAKSGTRFARRFVTFSSSAMSSSMSPTTPGRWIFTTAGCPEWSVTA